MTDHVYLDDFPRTRPVKILALLQNAWANDRSEWERVLGHLAPAVRRRVHTRCLFSGCATGRRLRQAFGDQCDTIVWDNASPLIGDMPSSLFPADPEHIRALIAEIQPDIILAFGRVAEAGVLRVWTGKTLIFPHPASRQLQASDWSKWRGMLQTEIDAIEGTRTAATEGDED